MTERNFGNMYEQRLAWRRPSIFRLDALDKGMFIFGRLEPKSLGFAVSVYKILSVE
jgi:hypothetical protein